MCTTQHEAIHRNGKSLSSKNTIHNGDVLGRLILVHQHVQNVNRFVVSALIQSDAVLTVIRRELRRIAPGTKVSIEELKELLPDILKRDVLEGETAEQAWKRVQRALKKAQKARQAKTKKEPAQQE